MISDQDSFKRCRKSFEAGITQTKDKVLEKIDNAICQWDSRTKDRYFGISGAILTQLEKLKQAISEI